MVATAVETRSTSLGAGMTSTVTLSAVLKSDM